MRHSNKLLSTTGSSRRRQSATARVAEDAQETLRRWREERAGREFFGGQTLIQGAFSNQGDALPAMLDALHDELRSGDEDDAEDSSWFPNQGGFPGTLAGFFASSAEPKYVKLESRRQSRRRRRKLQQTSPSPFETTLNATSGSTSPELIMATQTIETGCDRKTHQQFSRKMACYCGISLKVFNDFSFLDPDSASFFMRNARAEQRNFYMFAHPRHCQLPLPASTDDPIPTFTTAGNVSDRENFYWARPVAVDVLGEVLVNVVHTHTRRWRRAVLFGVLPQTAMS